MKLILCEACSDIVALKIGMGRSCSCGQSGGRYINNLDAEVWGPCFKIGFANASFIEALSAQKFEGDSKETMIYGYERVTKGRDFKAFIIPESAETMKRVEKPNV